MASKPLTKYKAFKKNKKLIETAVDSTNYMSLYMKAVSDISRKQMRVIRILGRLLTNKTHNEKGIISLAKIKVAGTSIHYSIGILFVYLYHLLWKNGITKPNLKGGVTLGFANGLLAIGVWYLYMKLHPNPPQIDRKSYLMNLIVAHIIFGTVAAFDYNKQLYLPGKRTFEQSNQSFLS